MRTFVAVFSSFLFFLFHVLVCMCVAILSLLANKSSEWCVVHKLCRFFSFFSTFFLCVISVFLAYKTAAMLFERQWKCVAVNSSFRKTLIVTYDANCHTLIEMNLRLSENGFWVYLIWINSVLILWTTIAWSQLQVTLTGVQLVLCVPHYTVQLLLCSVYCYIYSVIAHTLFHLSNNRMAIKSQCHRQWSFSCSLSVILDVHIEWDCKWIDAIPNNTDWAMEGKNVSNNRNKLLVV